MGNQNFPSTVDSSSVKRTPAPPDAAAAAADPAQMEMLVTSHSPAGALQSLRKQLHRLPPHRSHENTTRDGGVEMMSSRPQLAENGESLNVWLVS